MPEVAFGEENSTSVVLRVPQTVQHSRRSAVERLVGQQFANTLIVVCNHSQKRAGVQSKDVCFVIFAQLVDGQVLVFVIQEKNEQITPEQRHSGRTWWEVRWTVETIFVAPVENGENENHDKHWRHHFGD